MNLFIIVLITITVISVFIAFVLFKENKSLKKEINLLTEKHASRDKYLIGEIEQGKKEFQELSDKFLSDTEVSKTEIFWQIMQNLLEGVDWFDEKNRNYFFVEKVKGINYLMYKSHNGIECVGEFIDSINENNVVKQIELNYWFYHSWQCKDLLEKMQKLFVLQKEKEDKTQAIVSLKTA